MSKEAYSPPALSEWLVASMQLVLFPVDAPHVLRREWWKELTGQEPDESSRRMEITEEAGRLGPNRHLLVSVDPFRIKWTINAVVDSAEQFLERMPALGPLPEEQIQFLDLLFPWLPKAPAVKRVGVSLKLLHPVATHKDGYLMLDRLLQTVDVDPESSDFLYRVNRKTVTKSAPAGVPVNQLMGWAAHKLTAKVGHAAGDAEEVQRVVSEVCFTLLELDVNTHQARTEAFAAVELAGLCRELLDIAIDRVRRGDTRG